MKTPHLAAIPYPANSNNHLPNHTKYTIYISKVFSKWKKGIFVGWKLKSK